MTAFILPSTQFERYFKVLDTYPNESANLVMSKDVV